MTDLSAGIFVLRECGPYLSPSAGTTSSILSFWLISSMRRWRVYASSCSLVIFATIAVGRPIRPAALFSEASPHRLRFLRRRGPSASRPDLEIASVFELQKHEHYYHSRSGLRPRFRSRSGPLENPSSKPAPGASSSGLSSESPPNLRRFPKGMLLEPVIPWFLHDILNDMRVLLMRIGQVSGVECRKGRRMAKNNLTAGKRCVS